MRPAYRPQDLAHFRGCSGPVFSLGMDPDLHNCPMVLLRTDDRMRTVTIEGINVVRVPDSLTDKRAAEAMCAEVLKWFRDLVADRTLSYEDWLVGVVEEMAVLKDRTKRPEDILLLAQVAGAFKGAFGQDHACGWARWQHRALLAPLTCHWKGGADKLSHQRQTWRALGYSLGQAAGGKDPYWVPRMFGVDRFKKSDWKHLGDAAGMAWWGLEEVMKA